MSSYTHFKDVEIDPNLHKKLTGKQNDVSKDKPIKANWQD